MKELQKLYDQVYFKGGNVVKEKTKEYLAQGFIIRKNKVNVSVDCELPQLTNRPFEIVSGTFYSEGNHTGFALQLSESGILELQKLLNKFVKTTCLNKGGEKHADKSNPRRYC